MDEEYDVVVLGTGLTECILSGLLSVEGKKVLHMDRNDYYGGDSASLNLTQLFRKYRAEQSPPESLGRDRDYNIDLIPKFLMAAGELSKILVHTNVTRYLEFKQISGSYVYRDGKVSKVPSNEQEALSSPLLGFFEKFKMRSFLAFMNQYDVNNPKTWQGTDLTKTPMKDVFKKFGLDPGAQDFIGHALALYLNEEYKEKPAIETYHRMVLYTTSLMRYGKSPYIYPLYGLGELPQGFARLSAIYGGTYMLDKKIDEIIFNADGAVTGVRSGEEVVKTKAVVCDPSYVSDRKKTVGKVIRSIFLLKHPIPTTAGEDSLQLIIPQNQVHRKNDIYVAVVSSTHNVCPKDFFVAIVSTIVETNDPTKEIAPAVALLGDYVERFDSVSDLVEPTDDGVKSRLFISKAYDATSHFESVCDDITDIWKRITGEPLVLKPRPEGEQDQE